MKIKHYINYLLLIFCLLYGINASAYYHHRYYRHRYSSKVVKSNFTEKSLRLIVNNYSGIPFQFDLNFDNGGAVIATDVSGIGNGLYTDNSDKIHLRVTGNKQYKMTNNQFIGFLDYLVPKNKKSNFSIKIFPVTDKKCSFEMLLANTKELELSELDFKKEVNFKFGRNKLVVQKINCQFKYFRQVNTLEVNITDDMMRCI